MSPAPIPAYTPDRAGLIEYLELRRFTYARRARNASGVGNKALFAKRRDRFAEWKRLVEEKMGKP